MGEKSRIRRAIKVSHQVDAAVAKAPSSRANWVVYTLFRVDTFSNFFGVCITLACRMLLAEAAEPFHQGCSIAKPLPQAKLALTTLSTRYTQRGHQRNDEKHVYITSERCGRGRGTI
ncbi:hypothetical protein F2P81_000792 [Scophthalmus maximus]|uniref:Uncharacterized protein n=1 Tax=Scophthalmus maximus TaxID=52904 RepID=A0A6A4TQJ8_SCOMX|nr:hypothetical protein F2P81_000792 [Scophthalmus maximus]